MFRSKYSNFLTVILIIAIIAILTLATVLVVNVYKKHHNDNDSMRAIREFQNNIDTDVEENNAIGTQDLVEQNVVVAENSTGGSGNGRRKVTYYNNFVMVGYIEIPKINIKYPVLEEETVASLEQSVAIRYPSNATLNQIGNVVIAGHNYRNGQFFSKLKNVAVGDIVKITDSKGQTLVYTVYEVYQTTPEDTAYMTRDYGENIEITLVTCTDDSKARIIVKAKV